MHNINSRNKKKHTAKLFSAYGLMAVTLAVMTYVLVLVAAGYDIDRQTGQVIQNGALLVESYPQKATVFIDGEEESDKTPSRLPLPQGEYDVRLELEDYRSWQAQVEVGGSEVTWLYYPQLIPNVIETSTVAAFDDLYFFEANAAASQIAIQTTAQKNRITLYNLNDTALTPLQVVIPTAIFEQNDEDDISGTIEFMEWSNDSSYILIKQQHGDQSTPILVDVRNPIRSKNIERELGFAVDEVFFGPRNNDVYIVHGGLLRSFDKANGTASSLLFEGVEQYGVEDDDVWVLRVGSEVQQNGVFRLGDRSEPIIELAPEDRKTMLVSNYDSKPNIVLVGDDKVQVYTDVRRNLRYSVPEKVMLFSDPNTQIEFSKSGHFLSVSQSNKTLVYDLEDKHEYDLTIGPTGSLGWLDGHRLHYSDDSQLHIIDFNGFNAYQIARFNADWPVHLSEKRGSIYTVGRQAATNRPVLHRSVISLEDPR